MISLPQLWQAHGEAIGVRADWAVEEGNERAAQERLDAAMWRVISGTESLNKPLQDRELAPAEQQGR